MIDAMHGDTEVRPVDISVAIDIGVERSFTGTGYNGARLRLRRLLRVSVERSFASACHRHLAARRDDRLRDQH